ncbi:MAG: CBS domain-containing protein [Nitrospirota bacterium]
MKISEIMTKKVYTIGPNSSLRECAKILERTPVNGLVVTEGKEVVGVITKTDIFKAILPRYPENIEEERHMSDLEYIKARVGKFFEMKVKDIMGSPPITVSGDVPIIRAGSIMLLRRVKQIPVVREGQLVGIVTLTDIIGKTLKRLESPKGRSAQKKA